MYSQLPYTIAKQHQAELIQAADRARLAAHAGTRLPESQPTTTLNRFRGRIAFLLAQATARS
ncbi:MAG TPA: hypothetical protein VME22_25195 [Solirubrobacteraceae bacterium]|nr:hypothetical protein [Solirubrobacteraceae bacterium]